MFRQRSLLLFMSAIIVLFSMTLLSAKTITETILVKSGKTYDGKGETITAKGMGDGSQSESQKPIFKLEKGAKLKNVKIGKPGCDGVHCYGSNTVENVTWLDIGEDALTVKKGGGTISVIGGSAKNGDDKCFQINAACNFVVKNFTCTNVGKLIRQNGGKTFKVTITLENVKVNGAKYNVFRTDSKSTTITCKGNNQFNNIGSTKFMVPSSSQVIGCEGGSSGNDNKKAEEEKKKAEEEKKKAEEEKKKAEEEKKKAEEEKKKAEEEKKKAEEEKKKQTDIRNLNNAQQKGDAAIYNAVTNSIQLSKPASTLIVEIIGFNGKQLMTEHITMSGSIKARLALPIQQIESGCYIMKTTIDGAVSTQNILVY